MATTLKVEPLEIKMSVEPGKLYEESLIVENVGSQRYSYLVDCRQEDCHAWANPTPELVAINAQASYKVVLKLTPPLNAKIGWHKFLIVVANDENPDDSAEVNLALKVPIPAYWWVIFWIVVFVVLLVVFYWQSGAYS